MMIRHTCMYMIMASGMLLFAGCSVFADRPEETVQADRTLESQPKGVAGAYSDIGSNGSIKAHTESSYHAREARQGRTDGEIILVGGGTCAGFKNGSDYYQRIAWGNDASPRICEGQHRLIWGNDWRRR